MGLDQRHFPPPLPNLFLILDGTFLYSLSFPVMMVDVVYEFKKFSQFVTFRIMNFTHASLAEQIALCCAGLGFLMVLLAVILFLF